MTFSSLQTDLQRYLERGTSVDAQVFAQLPRLINLAERAIARALKVSGFTTSVISQLQASVNTYAKPDRWRRTISMSYGSQSTLFLLTTEQGQPLGMESGPVLVQEVGSQPQNARVELFPRSLEYCRAYWPDSTQLAAPVFYADYDYQHWLIVPTPDFSYPWEIVYYQQPPLLDTTTTTNWLTEYAPNALLYRALLEATPFLKNDERIGTWKDFYTEEMANLNTEDLQRVVDRTAVRNED